MAQKKSSSFKDAAEIYGEQEVDVSAALRRLSRISLSLPCWQGDDVRGFDQPSSSPGGGLAVIGAHPGRARNPDELRKDLDLALSLIPGKHRVSLHASYGDFGPNPPDRNEVEPGHFSQWIQWARQGKAGLDFNPTFFNHPLAADGFTLSHPGKRIRRFWIEHGIRARKIGAEFGRALRTPCLTNFWIPDGCKDRPVDRAGPRERLLESLDEIFHTGLDARLNQDAVEPKLFGLGSESYVVGSHEFYLGYALTRKKVFCLDTGHYHPTENLADKISALLTFFPELLLHLSRGVRWDSDHVVSLNDELLQIAEAAVSADFLNRIHFGLDFFDATINRVAAWVIGARNVQRALLIALLMPPSLARAELEGNFTERLALQEEAKAMPWGPVWDEYCREKEVPVGKAWLQAIAMHDQEAGATRND